MVYTPSGLSRRSVLKGIATSGAGIGAIGTVSADDQSSTERQLYIVLAGGNGLRRHIESAGFEVLHELAGGSVLVVRGPSDKRDELRTMAVVEDAIINETHVFDDVERTANEPVSADEPLYEEQWDKQLTRAAAAHDRATGEETTIAVIDTGVSHEHPVLSSRIDAERSRLFRYGRVHSGTDEVLVAAEPVELLPRVTTTTQPVAGDVHGHGTHVAGIAAAARDTAGIVGMAPDANVVSLRPMFFERVTDIGGLPDDELPEEDVGALVGTTTDILLAIDYAAEIGVDVINLSLGRFYPSDSRAFSAYRRVIQHAIKQDVIVVAAAHNFGMNLDHESDYILPADTPGAMIVAATGPSDKRSHYSNYGDGTVDVAAPGGGYETIEKTTIEDSEAVEYPHPTNQILSSVPETIYDEPYDYMEGTSMATPQVAGLACLLRDVDSDLHPRRVQQAIAQGTVDLSGEYTDGLGAGRIDAPDAIDRITNEGRG